MKILYISHTSDMHGSAKALFNLIYQVKVKGVDVHVIVPKKKGEFVNLLNDNHIFYSVFKVTAWIWPKTDNSLDLILFFYRVSKLLIKSFFDYLFLLFYVNKDKFNIIHTNVGNIHLGFLVAKSLNVSHVWHLREYQDLFFRWRVFPSINFFYKELNSSNNYPIAITKGIFNHYLLHYNPDSTVIYDGVFSIKSIPEILFVKDKYILYVGNISDNKGIKDAILCFIRATRFYPEFNFLIAGSGDPYFVRELKNIIINFNYERRIFFLGQVNDVSNLMSKAHALIVPSCFEGFGFITAEAMFNGCLVIGYNQAGTKEQFDNGFSIVNSEIGIRFNSFDELSIIIENICSEGWEIDKDLLINAQKAVISLYSSEVCFEKIYSYYTYIINKHGQDSIS